MNNPVGIMALVLAFKTIGSDKNARKSMPAACEVSYAGKSLLEVFIIFMFINKIEVMLIIQYGFL
jgi:hypothetical protein